MSQVHKMAGSSWHIEEHYDTKSYARNCVNCVCFQKEGRIEYSANGRPLVTVEKSTQYAKQVHLTKKLNTVGSPL